MAIHIPGSPGERAVEAGAEVLQAAFTAARQKFGDDIAQAEMFIKLAFGWLYYIKNEGISVDTLLRDYGVLRTANPRDIAGLQKQLAKFNV